MDNLGELITKHRKQKNMTQKELANLMYVSHQAVSKWENNLAKPDIDGLKRLSNVLDIDLSLLLDLEPVNVIEEINEAIDDDFREDIALIDFSLEMEEENKIINELLNSKRSKMKEYKVLSWKVGLLIALVPAILIIISMFYLEEINYLEQTFNILCIFAFLFLLLTNSLFKKLNYKIISAIYRMINPFSGIFLIRFIVALIFAFLYMFVVVPILLCLSVPFLIIYYVWRLYCELRTKNL